MNIKSIPALIAAGLLSGALAAPAAVIVTQSATAPITNVYKSQDVTGTASSLGFYWRASGSILQQSGGQTFSTDASSDYSLTAVAFNLFGSNADAPNKDFAISIYQVPNGAGSPATAGSSLVSSQSGTLPVSLITNDYITFTLDTPVTLAASSFYLVTFSFTEQTSPGSTANTVQFKTTGATPTVGGRRQVNSDGAWTSSASNQGFVFYAIATPVPEPSAWGLLGLSAAALLGFRKGRRQA